MSTAAPPLHLDTLFDGASANADALAAVMAHPRFADAMRLLMEGWTGMMRGNRLVNTIMTDRGRMMLSLFAIHLHGQTRLGDPASGLTPGRLKAILAPHDLASPGRIDAMLGLMRMLGYLAAMPAAEDRRLRRLKPTDKLLDWHRRRMLFTLEGSALVLADAGEAMAALPRPGFLQAMLSRLSEIYLGGYFYVDMVPEMRPLLDRNGGLAGIFSLLLAGAPDDTFPPQRPVPVSISGLARRFGASRAQMRRLFAEAEADGLVAREGHGEAWRILPRLDRAARRLTAHYILQHAEAARRALSGLAHQNLAA